MPRTGTEEIKHDDSVSTIFFCNECGLEAPCILSAPAEVSEERLNQCVIGGKCEWRVLE